MDDEDSCPPEPETPRFLLPEGCKDLLDALQLRELEGVIAPTGLPAAASGLSQPLASVVIPDPVDLRDLATLLGLRPFVLIGALMDLNVFTTLKHQLPFGVAAAICSKFGFAAIKGSFPSGGPGSTQS